MHFLTLLLLALSLQANAPSESVAHVVDGDTFDLGNERIRLCGIDTPERGKPGFKEAKRYLENLILNQPVSCRPVGEGTPCDGRSPKRSRKRLVAQCFFNGEDLATLLVRDGHAEDWPKYSGGYYRKP